MTILSAKQSNIQSKLNIDTYYQRKQLWQNPRIVYVTKNSGLCISLVFRYLIIIFDEALRIAMLTIIDIRKRKKIFENLKSFLNSFNRSEKHKLHKI